MGDTNVSDLKERERTEKNRRLYERQKDLLDTFLARGAISKQQHNKSLRDLTEKMHPYD